MNARALRREQAGVFGQYCLRCSGHSMLCPYRILLRQGASEMTHLEKPKELARRRRYERRSRSVHLGWACCSGHSMLCPYGMLVRQCEFEMIPARKSKEPAGRRRYEKRAQVR
jgi:hypothetical protein